MRDLRFRAWDGKYMDYNVWPTSDHTIGSWYMNAAKTESQFIEHGGGRVILMQFTGRQDKNGKDIYAGDDIDIIGNTVEFSFGCWNVNGDTPLYQFKDPEIVGNIYENQRP